MKKVGVIRGGVGPQYHISLQTGAEIQRALAEAGFEAVDMLLDKEGVLHIKGIPADMEKVQSSIDHVWNALHGESSEAGVLQRLFDRYAIPYTGSDSVSSAIAFNKQVAKEKVKELGVNIPDSLVFIPEEADSVAAVTRSIYKTIAPPWVLKPLRGSESEHTYFAFTPLELAQIVEESISHNTPFLVEQYIQGVEVAVGVIDHFRNTHHYVLPVVEVTSSSWGVLEHTARTSPHTLFPSRLRPEQREKVSMLAQRIHNALGAKDYSQSEFIIDRFGRIWFIEIDTHPALHKEAPFFKALEAVGASLSDFAKAIVS